VAQQSRVLSLEEAELRKRLKMRVISLAVLEHGTKRYVLASSSSKRGIPLQNSFFPRKLEKNEELCS
jgi:hypothetical protein